MLVACARMFWRGFSLWPLLTGPIAQRQRPHLADELYSSRSLWLQSVLSWVSEHWLPPPARAAAAGFVQRALLPFLRAVAVASSSTGSGGSAAGSGGGADGGAARAGERGGGVGAGSPSPRKKAVVRLVGGRLRAVDEEEQEEQEGVAGTGGDGNDRALLRSADAEEAKLLTELRSAAASATAGVNERSPARAPQAPSSPGFGAPKTALSPAAQRNPFVLSVAPRARTTAPRGSGGTGGGFLPSPWEQRLGAGSSAAGATGPVPALRAASEAESVSSLADLTRSSPLAPLFQREAAEVRVRTPAVEARRNSLFPAAETTVSRGGEKASRGAEKVSRRDSPRARSTGRSSPVSTDAESFEVTDIVARGGEKRYVTAAEAAAARASRVEQARGMTGSSVVRPRGSVVERWREMQRKQAAGEAATHPPASRAAPAPVRPGQKQQAESRKDAAARAASATVATAAASSEARAAFAAAAKAQARRGSSPDGASGSSAAAAAVVVVGGSTRDFASLAEASSAVLHRLVLSSWTVPELRDESSNSKPARGGRGGSAAREEHESGRLSTSRRLWLSKVCVGSIVRGTVFLVSKTVGGSPYNNIKCGWKCL